MFLPLSFAHWPAVELRVMLVNSKWISIVFCRVQRPQSTSHSIQSFNHSHTNSPTFNSESKIISTPTMQRVVNGLELNSCGAIRKLLIRLTREKKLQVARKHKDWKQVMSPNQLCSSLDASGWGDHVCRAFCTSLRSGLCSGVVTEGPATLWVQRMRSTE